MQVYKSAVNVLVSVLLTAATTPVLAGDDMPCQAPLRIVMNVTRDKDQDDRNAEAVAAHVGCKIVITYSPYKTSIDRLVDMLAKGQTDLVVGASKTPERERHAWFSKPYRMERLRLWARQGDVTAYAGMELKTLANDEVRILGPMSGWYGDDYQQLRDGRHPSLWEYRTFQQGVAMLLNRRGDVLLGDELWDARFSVTEHAQIAMLPQLVYEEPVYFMYSRKTVSPATVALMNEGFVVLSDTPAP